MRFKLAGRLLIAVAGVLVALCLSAFLARESVIAGIMASATGGDVGIERIEALYLTGIAAQGVTLSTDSYLFSAERIHLAIDLSEFLFADTLVIERLDLTDADLVATPAPARNRQRSGAGLPTVVLKAFNLAGLRIDYEDTDQDFTASVDRCESASQGNNVEWQCSGRINRESLALNGLYGLPDNNGRSEPFSLAVDWLDVSLGVSGRMDHPMSLQGAELTVDLKAARGTPLLGLLGINEVRDSPLSLSADYRNNDDGISVNLNGDIGGMRLVLSGSADNQAALDQFGVEFDLSGPSLYEAGALLNYLRFQDVPFSMRGKVFRDPSGGLGTEGVQLNLEDGSVTAALLMPEFPATENMSLTLEGDDMPPTLLQPLVGTCDLPHEAMAWKGSISVDPAGIENVDFKVAGPSHRLNVRGTLNTSDVTGAIDLIVNASGFTFEELGRCFNLELPTIATEIYTEFSWQNGLLTFRGMDLKSPLFSATGNIIVEPAAQVPFDIELDLQTQDARALADSLRLDTGPMNHFPLNAALAVSGDRTNIPSFSFEFKAANQPGTIKGSLGKPSTLEGLNLNLTLAGDHLGRLLIDPEKQARVDQPYSFSSLLQRKDETWLISNLELAVAKTAITGSARLTDNDNFLGSEVSINGKGANLENMLGPWLDVPVPNLPFEIEAAVSSEPAGARIRSLRVTTGEHLLEANVLIDNPPDYSASEGRLTLRGPSTQALMQIIGIDQPVLDRPYDLSLQIAGNRNYLLINQLKASAGESDLRGNIQLARTSPPTINVALQSNNLYLPLLNPGLLEEDAAKTKADRVFPDTPLPFGLLSSFNGELLYSVDNLWVNPAYKTSISADLEVRDAGLATRQFSWEGEHAKGTLQAELQPSGDTFEISAKATSDRLPLIWLLAGEAEPSDDTHFDLDVRSTGNSIGAIMGNLYGTILFKGGPGRFKGNALHLFFGDFMQSIAANISDNREKTTRINCTAGAISIEKGKALVRPGLLARTDKVDVFATGEIDLKKESPDLTVLTKSRTGIGLSAAKVIAPRLKVRGTLASPKFQIDTTGTAVNTWLALYSGGLSLIASGLWDRMTASANACGDLYRQAQELPAFRKEAAIRPAG